MNLRVGPWSDVGGRTDFRVMKVFFSHYVMLSARPIRVRTFNAVLAYVHGLAAWCISFADVRKKGVVGSGVCTCPWGL